MTDTAASAATDALVSGTIHPLAPHHLPGFLPGADGSDTLMTSVLIGLLVLVVLAGTFYLHLHSLPERLAHGKEAPHLELVAVLCLLALFTHNNFFWVAALLLAFIRIPDVASPLASIAMSLRKLAGLPEPEPEPTADAHNTGSHTDVAEAQAAPEAPVSAPAKQGEQ
ncbi:hypothetical protein [Roseibium sediminis]|uniref:hypothetical protein n=1 Tax=Roseibium sediminis TaxID=1775174 RepID=UPI001863F6D5|nr:hypothetical protein [Roseibium sediminis]